MEMARHGALEFDYVANRVKLGSIGLAATLLSVGALAITADARAGFLALAIVLGWTQLAGL